MGGQPPHPLGFQHLGGGGGGCNYLGAKTGQVPCGVPLPASFAVTKKTPDLHTLPVMGYRHRLWCSVKMCGFLLRWMFRSAVLVAVLAVGIHLYVGDGWQEANIPPLAGKTAVVTGANTGLGYETVRMMANAGSDVVMACRNLQKCEAARSSLQTTAKGTLQVMLLDLSEPNSIANFAQAVKVRHQWVLTGLCLLGCRIEQMFLWVSVGFPQPHGAQGHGCSVIL